MDKNAASSHPVAKPNITFRASRRQLIKTALVTGAGIAYAGFGPVPQHVFAQDKTKIVQWYHQYGEEGTQDAVMRYAQQFMQSDAGKNIEVEVNWQTGDYGPAIAAALLTDSGPDVFEINGVSLDMVKQGQVLPLDELYTPDVKSDFNPISLEAATIDGKIYWVKMIDDTGGLYYKPSVFKDKGLEPAKTLDDLINIAKTLNEGRVKGMFLGNTGGIDAAGGLLMWSGGGNFIDDTGKKVAFNTDGVATGFSKLKELNDSGALLIGAPTDYWDPSAFIQGLAATQWTGMWALPAIQKAFGDDVDIFPWPATDASGKASTFWGGWGECVNGKTKNADAAKALVQFLWIDSIDIQKDWALSYGFHVPPRKSAAAAAEQLKSGPAAKFVENLNSYGRITPPLWDAAMGTAYGQALTNVIQNGADPKTELAAAEKTAQAELDRLLGS
ncbi:MAG: extracellular solute-binding protein [Thermomicrobiales bacterium]